MDLSFMDWYPIPYSFSLSVQSDAGNCVQRSKTHKSTPPYAYPYRETRGSFAQAPVEHSPHIGQQFWSVFFGKIRATPVHSTLPGNWKGESCNTAVLLAFPLTTGFSVILWLSAPSGTPSADYISGFSVACQPSVPKYGIHFGFKMPVHRRDDAFHLLIV